MLLTGRFGEDAPYSNSVTLIGVIAPTLGTPFMRYLIKICDLFGGKDFTPLHFPLRFLFELLLAKGVQFLLLGKKGGLIRLGVRKEFTHLQSLRGEIVSQIPRIAVIAASGFFHLFLLLW